MPRGDEDLTEGLLNAFRLEKGAQTFYATAAERVQDKQGAAMFSKLADVEDKHMYNIYMLYTSLMGDRAPAPFEEFKADMAGEFTESGRKIEAAVNDVSGRYFMDLKAVLLMALEEEKTAREHYLRMADQARDPATSSLYRDLAEDEEKHIAMVQKALDQPGG
ncbi:MAG: ferritin family protein [bacterium]|nr:ferritin family protein [bacterium]